MRLCAPPPVRPSFAGIRAGVLVFLSLAVLASDAAARWIVLRQDDTGVVAEWTSEVAVDTVRTADGVALRLTVDEGMTAGRPGEPAIPRAFALVAAPIGAHVEAVATAAPFDPIAGRIAPVPTMIPDVSGPGYDPAYRIDRAAYARESDAPLIRTEPAGTSQNLALHRIVIAPVQYDAGRNEIGVVRRVTVTVRFSAMPAGLRRGPPTPEFWRGAVLNAEHAARWTGASGIAGARRARPAATNPFATGTWLRVYVKFNGIYRLRAEKVIAADDRFRDAPLDRLAMFGSSGRELPLSPTADRDTTLRAIRPILTDANADGKLNGADEIVFYGRGTANWQFAPCTSMEMIDWSTYALNRLTAENVYWLAIGDTVASHASRVDGAVTNPSAPEIARYLHRTHEEPENINFEELYPEQYTELNRSGLDWMWTTLPSKGSITVNTTLTEMAGDDVWIRVGQLVGQDWDGSPYDRTTEPYRSYHRPVAVAANAVNLTPVSSREPSFLQREQTFRATVPAATQRSLAIRITNRKTLTNPDGSGSTFGQTHLDYWEVLYWRNLVARDTSDLAFTIAPFCGAGPDEPVQVLLRGVDRTRHRLFDVTDDGLTEISLPEPVDGVTRVQLARSGIVEREYILAANARWREPVRLVRARQANLRGRTGGVDWVVVAPQEFLSEANRLADWRRSAAGGGLRAAVVAVQDIYDEFAFGRADGTAIRDFLKFARANWRDGVSDPGLRYVLLLGDGHYDPRGILASNRSVTNWIPAYQEGFTTTDDFYVAFENTTMPEAAVGRLPAGTPTEAQIMVDKIIAYEKSEERGDWQNRAIFVADDLNNPEYPGSVERMFVDDSEGLTQTSLRAETVVEKIYGTDFRTVNGVLADATDALIDGWNRGALLINYIGHGSPYGWSHERIFRVEDHLLRVKNGRRLPIVTALTCSAAHFDDTDERRSLGEMVLVRPLVDGGAIAVVAATRLVFNTQNVAFARQFFSALYRNGSRRPRIGDAYAAAKLIILGATSDVNARKFTHLGDPATLAALPELPVAVSVNRDTLAALEPVTISGAVLTPAGSDTLRTFTGTALVSLFDSDAPVVRPIPTSTRTLDYSRPGAAIYRGMADVVDGRFSITGMLPREVVYGGTRARAIAQVWNDQIDGAGYRGPLAIRATSGGGTNDGAGPEIVFSRATKSGEPEPIGDGTGIAGDEPVRVWLTDPAGINVTGEIGHRLLLTVDDAEPADLTSRFAHRGSATTGWVDASLPPGNATRRVVVEAWDNWNNFSADSIVLRVRTAVDEVTLADLIAVPNPMDDETTFTWRTAGLGDDRADATIRIYTIAGRLVDSFTQPGIAEGPATVRWSPERTLANGVYLYQISVRRQSDGRTARAIERLAVLGN